MVRSILCWHRTRCLRWSAKPSVAELPRKRPAGLNDRSGTGDHDGRTPACTPWSAGGRVVGKAELMRVGTLAVTLVAVAASMLWASPASPTYAFTNGQGCNGTTFVN